MFTWCKLPTRISQKVVFPTTSGTLSNPQVAAQSSGRRFESDQKGEPQFARLLLGVFEMLFQTCEINGHITGHEHRLRGETVAF